MRYIILTVIFILLTSGPVNSSCLFNCQNTENNSADFKSVEKGTRFFVNQPDVHDGYQIHFIYMLDKDGKDS